MVSDPPGLEVDTQPITSGVWAAAAPDNIIRDTRQSVTLPLNPGLFESAKVPVGGGGSRGQEIWVALIEAWCRENVETPELWTSFTAMDHLCAGVSQLVASDWRDGVEHAPHPGSVLEGSPSIRTAIGSIAARIPACRDLGHAPQFALGHMDCFGDQHISEILGMCAAGVQWAAHPVAARTPCPMLGGKVTALMDAPGVFVRDDQFSVSDWIMARQKVSVLTTAVLYATAVGARIRD